MKHTQNVENILSLVDALQGHVKTRTATGLNDVCASLEVLMSEVLRITDGYNLKNTNLVQVNFPAIDLVDQSHSVAIQVTSNVTTEKWQETVDKFTSAGLDKNYSKLIILGFCAAVRPRKLPKWVTVQGPEQLTLKIRSLDATNLGRIEKLLRQTYDFSKLSPLLDEHCFAIVFRTLNRDAVRHRMNVEGSYPRMAKRLRDVKQLITEGQITGTNIFAKPLSQYSPPYRGALDIVELQISLIQAELNRSRVGHIYDLDQNGMQKIDSAKDTIIATVNDLCTKLGLPDRIQPIP